MTEERTDKVTEIWKQYQNGIDYQNAIHLPEKIKTNVAFYEGDQWAEPTDRTKCLPRPVVNIIKMIVRAKKSAILSTPVRIVYEADSGQNDTQSFTRFADYICKEMNMAELDSRGVLDGANKGSYFYHFYWDKDAHGKKGNFDGAMRCDNIDARHIFFSNPAQVDIQKQKWIIIATREEVDAVKAQAAKGVDKDLICTDEINPFEAEQVEQNGTEMCTVLTRYSRQNGEVYCEKATQYVVFKPAFPISPDYGLAAKELGFEDEANTDSPDNPLSDKAEKGYRATLYPIAAGQYESKENCIYGMSEVEGLIPNQKCINFNLAMLLLSVQQTAWAKWIVSRDALKGQEITNEPGQVIIDNSPAGNGIRQEHGGQISALPATLIDNILSYTRTVSGSTEVMTGEATSANMSGAAIAQLQAQAQQPIEELRDSFWRVKEQQGRILEQFFRLFYDKPVQYAFKVPKDEQKNNPNDIATETFDSKKFEDVNFTVVAKACSGTRSSTAGDITFLDSLLNAKAITVLQYAQSYPDNALSDKDAFLKLLEQSQNDELQQTKALLAQREQQLVEASKYLEQYQKIIDASQKTANENKDLRGDIALLYQEFTKLNDSQSALLKVDKETYDDASLFARELAKNNPTLAKASMDKRTDSGNMERNLANG